MTNRSFDHADHADHDLLLIAEFAAGGISADQEAAASAQTGACAHCATLADDLRALSRATAELPPPARPRDFTLTPETASRIRRRGWRRLLAAFGTPRFELVRPLATGLTTLGLAGFLLAAVPGLVTPSPAAPTTAEMLYSDGRSSARQSPQAPQGAENESGDSGRPADVAGGGSGSLAAGQSDPDETGGTDSGATLGSRAASPLAVLSGSFLIVGLGLFALRWTARRLGDG